MKPPELKLVVIRTLEVERLAAFYRCIGMQFVEEQDGSDPDGRSIELSASDVAA